MLKFRFIIFVVASALSTLLSAMPVSEYLPKTTKYNANIPVPSATLGFEVGQRHIRHDQLNQYFKNLAERANRVKITNMGFTAQHRTQLLVTISSPENLSNIDQLLAQRHLPAVDKNSSNNDDQPLVIWLGYSVHGDEISGANAAMIVAYYLAASEDDKIKTMLANTIIVLEPSINPDGMDRFAQWVNTYRNMADNSDPNHIEHNQGWLSGRTNHYWFDLNRDWLLLSQQESQHRLRYFHLYQPNILGDFHEMGANSSYFFQPGVPSRTHPLTPSDNSKITKLIAGFHAKALDKQQRLYYSEENFDDFYYGKGSTYPDINGSIGILFEQASSRGMMQDSINGLLTFEFGIQNHVLTSLSTIEGAWQNKALLQKYRRDFYQEAKKLAKREKFNGYLIRRSADKYRFNAFVDKLRQHQINVLPLTADFRFQGQVFSQKDSFYIPLAQAQFRVIQALFNQQTDFKDNTFYDVSGWTLPLAMNIEFHKVDRTWGLKLAEKNWTKPLAPEKNTFDATAYAYVFEWHDFLAPKLLNALLRENIKVRVATKNFSSVVDSEDKAFSPGSIMIPAGIQTKNNWRKRLQVAANKSNITVFSVNTGFTPSGVDLGSGSFEPINAVKVLMIGGLGISQYEAGEVRYYLDGLLNIPVSIIDHHKLSSIDLSVYSHIILVDGSYSKVGDKVADQLSQWTKKGGVLIGQKRAAKWLSDKDILKAAFVSKSQIDQLFDTEKLQYKDKEALAARKRIAGAIFETKLDTSHPLAYGYEKSSLPLFRNSTLIMNQPTQPFMSVAQYSEHPLMSGYTDNNLVNRIANNAAIVAHNLGEGRVIATTDDMTFRGYWFGSAKILANSLFFAKAFYTPIKN